MIIETLLTRETIEKRIQVLCQEISRDYQGQEILLLCVLKGAFIFCADLMRNLSVPSSVEFISLSSYGKEQESSGKVTIRQKLNVSLKGKHVLVVEDIVDTGLTLNVLLQELKEHHPASLKLASLLFKPAKLKHPLKIDYLGFSIEDRFVVGYGLDFAEKYRELPFVGVMNEAGA